jgi:hypothetical protein
MKQPTKVLRRITDQHESKWIIGDLLFMMSTVQGLIPGANRKNESNGVISRL